jgi:hypothetical protein
MRSSTTSKVNQDSEHMGILNTPRSQEIGRIAVAVVSLRLNEGQ